MSNQEMPLSCYEEISQLNKDHRVSIVRQRGTGKIYVKKILSVYSLAVYSALYDHPVKHTPRICALYEDRGTLTVIEEYISGDSLEEILEKRGPLTEQETILAGSVDGFDSSLSETPTDGGNALGREDDDLWED